VLSSTPTRVAVVGCGAFGKNHLRVWRQLAATDPDLHLVALVEPDAVRAAALSAEYAIPAYPSAHSLLAEHPNLTAASVAVPTSQHAPVAASLLAAGVDVLLEKPLTSTLAEADHLIRLATQHARILQPGHLERFNPAVQAVRPLLNRPMFFEAHRLSIFTPRSLDVDVVLDLMIHDLDIVCSFAASPVRTIHAVGLPILTAKVDIANVRVEFDSGCVANFTASRVSTEQVRKLRFFQPHQYISIDYARQDVLNIDVSGLPADPTATPPDGLQHPTPQFNLRKLPVQSMEPLRLELESFLHSVRTRTQPAVSPLDGRAALALALDILSAIQTHHDRAGLHTLLRPVAQ
jgi:predicted dehydrogenase